MYYIAIKAPPKYHQMTLDELIYGLSHAPVVCMNETNTKTYETDRLSERFLRGFSVEPLIQALEKFNAETDYLRQQRRRDLYYTFFIPKSSGGLRRIDAPEDDLMAALRRLKFMFEVSFHAPREQTTIQTSYYHTSAFAYIKKRSTLDAVKRHQSNKSKWFAKLDFSNFFGTTTLSFTMHMMSMVFPFSEICKSEHGRQELEKAVELGFLDGVLPQGTPLSPLLTNIIMMPLDFRLFNKLRDLDGQHLIYTRYADDMLISSRGWFNVKKIERLVVDVLREFNAPYRLNRDKTRYGSIAGSNWNLGVILNKDNEITVGYKNIRRFKAMLSNYAMDRRNGIRWSVEDLQTVLGIHSYYKMVEGDKIDGYVDYVNKRFHIDVIKEMKKDLRPAG